MSDDDDDPVVEEIPVYLTHSLADHLYVFQYPVVPCTNSGLYNVVKSKIKPENGEVALDLGLDTASPNFDYKHAEQIAVAIDHDKSNKEKIFNTNIMDTLFLESTRVLTDCDSFGIGLMHGRELHISPIQGIISLTPSLRHLHIVKEEDNEEAGDEGGESGGGAAASAAVAAVPPPGKGSNPRRSSYSNYMKKLAQEAWHVTDYFDPNTPKAEAERVALCRVECRSGVWLSSDGWELGGTDTKGPPVLPPTVPLTLAQLPAALGLPLGAPLDEGALARVLATSVIVRGHFLPRSDLVYPQDSTSTVSGVKGDIMARARDYILYQLNEGRGLRRSTLSEVVRIPQSELDEILESVAIKSGQEWVFKYPPDMEFISRYSHIVEQQKMLWEARYKQVMESFESSGAAGGSGSPRAPRRRRESECSGAGAKAARQTKTH